MPCKSFSIPQIRRVFHGERRHHDAPIFEAANLDTFDVTHIRIAAATGTLLKLGYRAFQWPLLPNLSAEPASSYLWMKGHSSPRYSVRERRQSEIVGHAGLSKAFHISGVTGATSSAATTICRSVFGTSFVIIVGLFIWHSPILVAIVVC